MDCMIPMENLQFFEEGKQGNDMEGNHGTVGSCMKEEKTFTQGELDRIIEKRLVREKLKWAKAGYDKQKSKDSIRLFCYEQGVYRNSIDDVLTLANVHVGKEGDMTEAIRKVLKKYPHFKMTDGDEKKADSDVIFIKINCSC